MLTEFEFIARMRSAYDLGRVGDDCAVLPKDAKTDLVITTDLLIEAIDFRLDWTQPDLVGHKALAVSLSDVAAMGAQPRSALVSLGVPENIWHTDFLDLFYSGWHELAGHYGVELVGGDVSRSPEHLVIDSILIGDVPKDGAVLRSGAKPGDGLFVAGTLGGAAGGLRLFQNGRTTPTTDRDRSLLIDKQLKPSPHVRTGNLLQQQHLATAMLDISDGLSSDLHHLCSSSGVGARIYAERLPIEVALISLFSPSECLDMALNGGEDLALLFTGDAKRIITADIPDVTRIGDITTTADLIELIVDGNARLLEPKGYRHF